MRVPTITLTLTLFAAACGTESPDPGDDTPPVRLPPGGGINPIFTVPSGGPSAFTGGFTFTGPTAPGSASWTDAPLVDFDGGGGPPPDTFGGGSMSITINGTLYESPALESMSVAFTADDGTQYVALDGYMTYDNAGVEYASEATVILLRSDITVPGTVELDGMNRVALFANGPADAMDPTLVGAAVTGTVTLSGGSLADGILSGSVAGDFGQIDYTPGPPPGGGSITAGDYTLALVGGTDVYCDGTLAGHESDFTGITADSLGLVGGAVSITDPSPSIDISGDPITSGFLTSPFTLDEVDTGLYAGFTDETGSGPDTTTFAGKYLVLDGMTATPELINGGVGAGYYTASGDGTCTVSFGATLTAP